MLRVDHVAADLGDEGQGPSLSVQRLCESLANAGLDTGLICTSAGRQLPGVRTRICPSSPIPRGFAFSWELAWEVRRAYRGADIVHHHSLWSFPNFWVGLTKPRLRTKLVASPRGTLAEEALRRSAWKKHLMGPLQRPALTRADCIHATSSMELADIRRVGLVQPVAVIPNGIDVPPPVDRSVQPGAPKRLLYLGRIHPIKGLELLIDIWTSSQHRFPDWELVIAGKGESSYVRALRDRSRRQGAQRIVFWGPAYGSDKSALYHSSDLFVLPTKTENFAMVVAEALAHSVPVVTTKGAPWSELISRGCGFWIERNHHDFGQALTDAMALPRETLRSMGDNGRTWMLQDFDWQAIGARMSSMYNWLIAGGTPPDFVHV